MKQKKKAFLFDTEKNLKKKKYYETRVPLLPISKRNGEIENYFHHILWNGENEQKSRVINRQV